MIGSKKVGSKTALGVLAELVGSLPKDPKLRVGAGAKVEKNWNAIDAARKFEAAPQKFDVEKYRILLRRY